jgi:hypothetical protein
MFCSVAEEEEEEEEAAEFQAYNISEYSSYYGQFNIEFIAMEVSMSLSFTVVGYMSHCENRLRVVRSIII